MAATALMDSYSESNQKVYMVLGGGYSTIVGQSFTASAGILDYCKFYLVRVGASLTGTAYAKVYSHSGVYGTSSLPDTLLATSDGFDVSALTTSLALYTFTFTGTNKISLSAAPYVLTLEFSGGDGSKFIGVGADSGTPTHSGNACSDYPSLSMTAFPINDICFYVYRLTNDHEGAPTRIRTPQYVA